ncbi:hypothetical protein ALQ91_200165 [Pseudomonas syringae pv. syringae]|nr:hypothetical protein ALQ91_200165 [Pseudomonas syringae pv. syringae]
MLTKKTVLENALKRTGGKAAAAARSLGLDRANLMRLAARLGVSMPGN